MLRWIRWFLFVVVSAIVALFGLSNLIPVRVNFLFFATWINMPVPILGTFLLGALVGGTIPRPVGFWHIHLRIDSFYLFFKKLLSHGF